MTNAKYLGIWMDHSIAHLMEYNTEAIETTMIPATFTSEDSTYKGEGHQHYKEQGQQAEYFKKLAQRMLDYEGVLLFGPTEAKQELFNLVSADHRFDKIKIEVKSSDKMTTNQEHAFVRDHFSKK